MPEKALAAQEFRRFAEQGIAQYGEDPWFFLRELAQNSRDAAAQAIYVSAARLANGRETVIFFDDGSGMSQEHARKYLFRLYASSKERDAAAAGKYGIGFWTILRFQPDEIIIESRSAKSAWAVSLNQELQMRETPCRLDSRGIRVTLSRLAQLATGEEFSSQVEAALTRYCRFLRRNDRRASPLPVYFRGKNILLPLRLDGLLTSEFRRGPVEGAVGLGPKPKVTLFARGLPVWEGSSLQELMHAQPEEAEEAEIATGLAPIFLINGNDLDITMTRRQAMDNRKLQRAQKVARLALARLVRDAYETTHPAKQLKKWRQRGKMAVLRWLRSFHWQLVLALLLLIPLEILLLAKLFPRGATPRVQNSFLAADYTHYAGATPNTPARTPGVNLHYLPGRATWFRIFPADQYDSQKGFVPDPRPRRAQNGEDHCRGEEILVQLDVPQADRIYLPVPVAYRILPQSIYWRQIRLAPALWRNDTVVVVVPAGRGWIRYQCCPIDAVSDLSAEEEARLSELPETVHLPAGMLTELAAFNASAVQDKVRGAARLLGHRLKYDTSPRALTLFRNQPNSIDWLQRVLASGGGDCDVLNGALAVLLRRLGIPCRLAIGLIGNNGTVSTGFHAWVEYWTSGWHIYDITSQAELEASAPVTSHAGQLEQDLPIKQQVPAPASRLSWLFLPVILCIFFLPLFLAGLRQKSRRSKLAAPRENIAQEFVRLVIGAILQPQMWSSREQLWDYQFLPTWQGKTISIRQALRHARIGKLFSARKEHWPGSGKIPRRTIVLDSSQSQLMPVLQILPGVIDLESSESLGLQPLARPTTPPISPLFKQANQILARLGPKMPSLLLATRLAGKAMVDIRLPAKNWAGLNNQRLSCIVVNPHHPAIQGLLGLFQRNSSLALFRFIRQLASSSAFIAITPDLSWPRLARMLLQESP